MCQELIDCVDVWIVETPAYWVGFWLLWTLSPKGLKQTHIVFVLVAVCNIWYQTCVTLDHRAYNGACCWAAIVGASILVACHLVKSATHLKIGHP